jgi:hypothetical protein
MDSATLEAMNWARKPAADVLLRIGIVLFGLALAWNAIGYASFNSPNQDGWPYLFFEGMALLTVAVWGLGLAGARSKGDVLLLAVGFVVAVSPFLLHSVVSVGEGRMRASSVVLELSTYAFLFFLFLCLYGWVSAVIVAAVVVRTKRHPLCYTGAVERAFQNRREFVTPTGHRFIARAIEFADPAGEIFLYWGGAFGRVDIRGLKVLTASN